MEMLAVLPGASSASFIPEKCYSVNQNAVLVPPLLRSGAVGLNLVS